MSRVRFMLNRKGVSELLKSEGVQELLAKEATEMAGRCGTGYEGKTQLGKNRAYANVRPVTSKAKRDNYKNNTLLKAAR